MCRGEVWRRVEEGMCWCGCGVVPGGVGWVGGCGWGWGGGGGEGGEWGGVRRMRQGGGGGKGGESRVRGKWGSTPGLYLWVDSSVGIICSPTAILTEGLSSASLFSPFR